MRRWAFTVAAFVSSLMCAGTLVLWVRSYWRGDEAYVAREWFEQKRWTRKTLSLWSGSGGVNIGWSSANTVEAKVEWGEFPNRVGRWDFGHLVDNDPIRPPLSDEVEPGHQKFGFGFGYADGFMHSSWRDGYQWEVVAPDYVLAIALAFLPMAWSAKQIRHRRRIRFGLCSRCSYNLTGNTSGVCPECGTPTTAGVKA